MTEKKDIEAIMDAFDKLAEGDETAFDGITIELDGEPAES